MAILSLSSLYAKFPSAKLLRSVLSTARGMESHNEAACCKTAIHWAGQAV